MELPGVGPGGSAGTVAPTSGVFPTSDPLPSRLFPPLATGVHWGLERTVRALASVGDPHLSFPTLHVGGTNGKGSVAATLASVLREGGRRVGLYTSPHLCSFRERFQVDGRALGEQELAASSRELRQAFRTHGLTFFEATTVLAFHALARAGVEVAVVEVGLGGRLDSTNVIRPEAAAVTNVALDHAEYLGDSLDAIAREKAGIIKEGAPFVTSESVPGLVDVFREVARTRGAPFHHLDPARHVLDVEVTRDGTRFTAVTPSWGEMDLRTPMVGRHQAVNAALAVRLLELLPADLRPHGEELVRGVAGVRWPGRLQVLERDGRVLVFDVAHNTPGALALAGALDRLELPRPLVLLVGILGDKEWKVMLPPLFRRADAVILTEPSSAPAERRWDPEEAARAVSWTTEPRIVWSFEDALAAAREAADGGTLVVTGSHHTVGDAMELMGVRPLESDPDPS